MAQRGHRASTSPSRRSISATPCTTSAGRRRRSRSRATAHAQLAYLPIRQVWLSLLIAQHAFDGGDWEAVAGDARRCGRAAPDGRHCRSSTTACGTPSSRSARDEREAAREHLTRAAELAVDSREPQYLGVLGALQAELAMRDGDVEAARAAVDEALDRIEFCSDDALRMAMVSAAGLAAEARRAQHARDLGDERGGRAALTHAELLVARVRACAEDGGPLEQAFLVNAEADHCRAAGHDDQARYAGSGGRRWARWAARTGRRARCWRQAEALVAAGDREAACAPVAAAAMETAERLGAAWLGRRAREPHRPRAPAARAARARRPPASENGDDPFGLTPRERQVLALVAAGATNREIGRQLYMAEKTASVHVSRILAKLDVRSRTEAAGVAHRLGLDAVV